MARGFSIFFFILAFVRKLFKIFILAELMITQAKFSVWLSICITVFISRHLLVLSRNTFHQCCQLQVICLGDSFGLKNTNGRVNT